MQTLFSPAVTLMNNLRYRSKFALLGTVAGLVIAVLLFTVFSSLNKDIAAARHEQEGLRMIKPLNRMVQLIQQHRGLSAGVLSGNETMKDKRVAKEAEAVEAVAAVEAVLYPTLRDGVAWKSIRQDWEDIRSQGLTWSAADNIQRHTQLFAKALRFMADVADASELTLDPRMDTYYFMDTLITKMPAVIEQLGISRARGTGILAKKEMSPQQRIDMASQIAQMSATLAAQNINIEKVMHYAPELKNALAEPAREFSDSASRIIALVRTDILTDKFETPSQTYYEQVTQVLNLGYTVMYDTLIPQFEKQLQQRIDAAQRALFFNFGLAILAALVVGYLAVGTYYSVINSVHDFSQGAQRLASGDLTVAFDNHGADELHAAAKDFNDMAAAFRSLLQGVQADVRRINEASEQVATASQQISSSSAMQSDAASSMAAAVEETTVGIDHIARNAQDAQNYSRHSEEVADTGGRIVHGVVQEIEAIAHTVHQSADAVEALGEQSQQISAIVDTIKDIADQTNLLALNAAIEAARAGETGRGFAVVADEVRKLAERTTKSTQEISEMIGAVQSGTATAVASMKEGVARVSAGVVQAGQAGEAISQVQAQSRQVREAVSEISSALREQTAASTEIAQSVERIAQMAEENNVAVSGNAQTADTLRNLAHALTSAISRFKT